MRSYKINKDNKEQLPDQATIEKYKDFSRLSHEYDRLTKRPKVPLYRDKKMFLVLLLIVLVAYLLSVISDHDKESDNNVNDRIEQTTPSDNSN
ncbi:MAG: hypothetical protein ACPG21_11000 [Crocinitomicaceae bacterium]